MEKRKIARIIYILTQWNGFGIVETEPNVFICLKFGDKSQQFDYNSARTEKGIA